MTEIVNSNNNYNNFVNLYVVIETIENKIVPISLEMLGEARRLMDDFNLKYNSNEKVIAIVLGHNIKALSKELIFYGADAVIFADNPNLKYPINQIYTKLISKIVTDKQCVHKISPDLSNNFKKPRYLFFAADNTGRHLSATVLAELDSGLASDINKLVISDLDIRHQHKTNGQVIKYEKTLEMYRPDFSGFLWTTILCLDNKNPSIKKEYHPQSCSIIPGAFKPIEKDEKREGIVIEYIPEIDKEDLKIKILKRETIKNEIDYEQHKIVISFGRGIKNNPDQNIKLVEELASVLNAGIGISLPISKKIYQVNEILQSKFIIPERVIGTSGQKISPAIYIAVGISGAIQHLDGMKESDLIIAINPDENSPICEQCDIFIKGHMEDILPKLIEIIKNHSKMLEIQV
ncbi:MAG: electron transfer flavoprotein subunit alpha/FixB family protein [Nitrososphaeraceae archaeon]